MSAAVKKPRCALRGVFARRVEQRRRELGLDKVAVAFQVGCSRSTFFAMLGCDVGVGVDRVAMFGVVLECSASFLLDDAAVCAPPAFDISTVSDVRRVLANNVERLMVARGFPNITALAEASSIAKSQMYDILAARCNTSIDNLERLEVPLRTRACELLAVI